MARQLHSVVEYPYDLDHVPMRGTVQNQMPPAPALPRDMQGSKVGEDFVAGDTSENVRSIAERGKRVKQRGSVHVCLERAESLSCVFQDAGEIFLGLSTKANPPTCLRQ
jgi:hypothetical protein